MNQMRLDGWHTQRPCGARWRSWRRQPDPALGRFAQPDTLVPQPGNPLAWDRYAYTLNNPVRYTDPSGHMVADDLVGGCAMPSCLINPITQNPPQEPSLPTVSQPEYTYVPVMTPNQGLTWTAISTGKPTPITDIIKLLPGSSGDWAIAGTVTDGLVLLLDLYADGVVVYATVAGFGSTLPVVVTGNIEVPAVAGGAAFLIADFFLVKPILTLGNYGASVATVFTYISETKSGATVIETGQISAATKNSFTLTLAGWMAPEAISSAFIQSTSFANDLGWISFPFH